MAKGVMGVATILLVASVVVGAFLFPSGPAGAMGHDPRFLATMACGTVLAFASAVLTLVAGRLRD